MGMVKPNDLHLPGATVLLHAQNVGRIQLVSIRGSFHDQISAPVDFLYQFLTLSDPHKNTAALGRVCLSGILVKSLKLMVRNFDHLFLNQKSGSGERSFLNKMRSLSTFYYSLASHLRRAQRQRMKTAFLLPGRS